VEGSDLLAVVDVMRRALDHARNGGGPVAIESVCVRHKGHFVGDPQPYRTAEELAAAAAVDPVKIFRTAAADRGLLGAADMDLIDELVSEEIEDAVKAALAAPVPPMSALESDVYVSY
jgi:pyruvate dehydrogenase E1 component alpha subunit